MCSLCVVRCVLFVVCCYVVRDVVGTVICCCCVALFVIDYWLYVVSVSCVRFVV